MASGHDGMVTMLVLPDGRCLALEFFEGLRIDEQAQLQHRFLKVANNRTWTHPEHFKRIEGTEFMEFKKHQARFPCFWTARKRACLVITHGFRKKRNRIDRQEIERAKNYRRRFEEGE